MKERKSRRSGTGVGVRRRSAPLASGRGSCFIRVVWLSTAQARADLEADTRRLRGDVRQMRLIRDDAAALLVDQTLTAFDEDNLADG